MKVGWISVGSTDFESSPSTSLPQPSSSLGSESIASASCSRVGCSAMSMPVLAMIASRSVTRFQGGASSISVPSRSTVVVPSTFSATEATSSSSRFAVSS